jgi:hypothetical protein
VCEGQFLLVADKSGFRHATRTTTADHETRVELDRRSSVAGIVVRPDGTPATSFSVRVVRSGDDSLLGKLESVGRSFESADGRFELADVAPGSLLLEATAEDFTPARLEVQVPRGESVGDLVVRLPSKGAALRGVVMTRNGVPVAGAQVTVHELGALPIETTRSSGVTTDARGAFVLERLAAATYQVKVSHSAFAPATIGPIVVHPEEVVEVLPVLQDGGTIAGRGRPGAMITLAGDAWSSVLATDEAGAFQVGHVPAGDYLLRAMLVDDGDRARPPEVHRVSVRVAEGEVTSVDLLDEEAKNRTFTGRVDPEKGGIALVLLRLQGSPPVDPRDLIFQGQLGIKNSQESRYVVAEGLVGADGSFALRGVPPGHYTQDVYVTSVLGTLAGDKAKLRESKEVTVE